MIFFIFFGLSNRVTENVSAEIASVVTEENLSIFYGEINKPRGIKLHQIERKSFQKNWFHLYHWLYYGKEKDTAFCYLYIQAMESEILVTSWKDDPFVTKGFRNWKKTLDIEKKKLGTFEKHNQSDGYKSAVDRQIILVLRSAANEQRKNRETLLKIPEKV